MLKPKDVAGKTCVIVTDASQMAELESEWNELWLKAKGSFYQSYSTAYHSWNEIARPAGRSLFCVVIRDNGKLTLVFPLLKYRKGPLWMLRPLGPNAAEVTDILVDPDSDFRGNVGLAWQTIARDSKADIIHMPFVKIGSPLDEFVHTSHGSDGEMDIAPFADLQDHTEWEAYTKEIFSANSRQQLKRKRKKLSELGNLEFEAVNPVTDPDHAVELMDWMFSQKKVWADTVGKHGEWLSSEAYRNFIARWITDPKNIQTMRIYAVLIDKKPVAITLFAHGVSHMELIIAGFHSDPQFAKYSPGIVLDEFWMKIAFERRQDVDFGVGSERYKLFWSRNNKVDVASYHIPQTLVGNITTQLWHLNRRAAPYVARHMRPIVDPGKNPSAPPS